MTVKYQNKVLEIPNDLTNRTGIGQVIEADKCDSGWTDKECPNPVTCAEYHYGQFGHKVMFRFCDSCYLQLLKERSDPEQIIDRSNDGRGFEIYPNSLLNKE